MLYSFLSNRFAFKHAVDQQSSYIERHQFDSEELFKKCEIIWEERCELLRWIRNHRCPDQEDHADIMKRYEDRPDDGPFGDYPPDEGGDGGHGGSGGSGPHGGGGGRFGVFSTRYSVSASRHHQYGQQHHFTSFLGSEGSRYNPQMVTSEIQDPT